MSLYDEGHTIAGWTGFGIGMAGSTVVGAGVVMASVPALVGGLVITAASVLVTWILHLTGWGKPPGVRPRGEWGMRTRDTEARAGHPGCVGCRLAGRGRRSLAVTPAAAPAPIRAESVPLSPVE